MRRRGGRSTWVRVIGAIGWLLVVGSAGAQVPLLPDELERIDVIALEHDGRDLFAFDALAGRRSSIRLEVDEEILWEGSRGRIGLVLTDRRALGVASGGGFQELRYRLQETPATVALVEDRVAVLATDRRALGFVVSGEWVQKRFTPGEEPAALRAGAAAGLVATNRRLLGLAPGPRRLAEMPLDVREVIESVNAQDTLVTVRTNRRILVFSAVQGLWGEERRQLDP